MEYPQDEMQGAAAADEALMAEVKLDLVKLACEAMPFAEIGKLTAMGAMAARRAVERDWRIRFPEHFKACKGRVEILRKADFEELVG
jgi:hypothetical protein